MADLNRGKTIFENRVEYPLPKKPGVRDYVFYFVPASDGYGRGARAFFDKFYPNHVKQDAGSLEALIATLHAEVTQHGVQQVREITMVAHGNEQELLLPVLHGVTATNLQEFKYLSHFSLAFLQKDFREGKFQAFQDQRKVVLAHLHNESWVTIRACKFGRWPQGLYATYVFFGGKPNVYAPREFQFFGSQPILPDMRLDTRLAVHQHLVKQRFFPKDIHTPERQDAIVKALVNRAQFSAPFAVASMPVTAPTPEDAARYAGLLAALNAHTTNDVLKAKFSEQGLALTALARVSVVAQNTQWFIKDEIKHEGTSFQIVYQIYEEVAFSNPGNRQTATLWAEAKLIDAYSAHEYFPIQLFFHDGDNDRWRNKLFTLAFYMEPAEGASQVDPQHETHFKAVEALLNSNKFSDGTGSGVDIKAAFTANGITLTDQAKLTLQSSTGSDVFKRTVWALDDQEPYLIKLEHPRSSDGVHVQQAHTLTVYSNPVQVTRLRREYELMSYLGTDPDTPGTELTAYLDRFSIEDLVSLIDYLRAPFKPGHSVYIHHALQALQRKKDFSAWVRLHQPIKPDTVLLEGPTYYELSRSEEEDKHTLVYQYDFNNIWREIKAQTPATTVGQEDLFFREAEDLAKKLKIVANRNAPPDQVPDSPYTDLEELRALEKRGVERFFSTGDKDTFEAPEGDQQTDCEEFKFAITKWQEVQHQEPETIKRLLGTQKTPGGKSVLDIILQLGEHHNFLKDMAKLVEIAKLPTFPSRDEVIKGVAKRGFLRLGFQTLAHLIELDFIFTIPFTMWMEVLEIQQKALETWRLAGKLTAITHWLWALDHLTYTRKDDFPDELEIDISTPHHLYPDRPYFLSRYYSAVLTQRGTVAALHDDVTLTVLRAGFDEAVSKMDKVEVEILRNADDALSDVLRQANLDSCKIKVLTDAGILEIKKLKALVVRALAQAMLDNIPKVPR